MKGNKGMDTNIPDGFSGYSNLEVAADPKRNGVWLRSNGEVMAFLPRNVIIEALSALADIKASSEKD
jgi:hypothetical protein